MSEEMREARSCRQRSRLSRFLWTALGTFFLALGVVGAVLPVMPTTPFVLLAAACYAKGSERMHCWLMNNQYFGAYLRNYTEKKGMAPRDKALTIMFMWAGILFSIIVFVHIIWVDIVMLAAAALVTMHLMMLRTVREPAA